MHRNGGEADIAQSDSAAGALEWCKGLEVIEDVLGEVCCDGRRVLFGNGGDEDGVAEEELKVDGERVCVLRILVPQWLEDRCAVDVSLVKRSVDVVDQAVPGFRRLECIISGKWTSKPDIQNVLGCFSDKGPAIELLADGGIRVMLMTW